MGKKFGTFQGVFIPSSEAILGTVLFLLMPLITADVGLFFMLLIVLLAHTVTVSTAFSLSDCATNLNRIEGGGMYALTKLSLGTALGGSIGIQLYLAQAASIGFYCIGFTEPLYPVLLPLLKGIPIFQDMSPESILLQKQLIATVFCTVFFIIVMFGADFTLKIQMLILVVLGISIATIFISPLLPMEFRDKAVFASGFNLKGNRPLTLGIFFLAFTRRYGNKHGDRNERRSEKSEEKHCQGNLSCHSDYHGRLYRGYNRFFPYRQRRAYFRLRIGRQPQRGAFDESFRHELIVSREYTRASHSGGRSFRYKFIGLKRFHDGTAYSPVPGQGQHFSGISPVS